MFGGALIAGLPRVSDIRALFRRLQERPVQSTDQSSFGSFSSAICKREGGTAHVAAARKHPSTTQIPWFGHRQVGHLRLPLLVKKKTGRASKQHEMTVDHPRNHDVGLICRNRHGWGMLQTQASLLFRRSCVIAARLVFVGFDHCSATFTVRSQVADAPRPKGSFECSFP
jgi:hypothetical protein